MMPRKKRITIMIISIILIIVLIVGILVFLYLKTDLFKSKETLFAKYLLQNSRIIEMLNYDGNLEANNLFESNKYTSNITGSINYIENIETSDENSNSNINNVGLKIKSNIDKTNNYQYSDIRIGIQDEDLFRMEYLNEGEEKGIRLDKILQFVSLQSNQTDSEIQQFKNIDDALSKINLKEILNFSDEEIKELQNTYINILNSNISDEKYNKQSKTIITIENQNYSTNCYNVTMTIEELNNLYIQILEQISSDEIILSKVDLLEEQLKELISNNEEKNFREIFLENINNKIEEIKNSNIGSEEVKISVYENNMQTIRTEIEEKTNKITIDFYNNNSSVKITNTELTEYTNQEIIKYEQKLNNIFIEYQKIQDNEIINDISFNYKEDYQNQKMKNQTQIIIANEKNKATFNIEETKSIVDNFDEQITLAKDYIKLSELSEERQEIVNNILADNIQKQLENLQTKVNLEDYRNMFKKLGVINDTIELPEESQVTDIERRRFNSQFEFFVSEGLTTEHIKELMGVLENNFEDMKILTKDGNIENLDVNRLNSNSIEDTKYRENISEILIAIKEDSKNENKQKDTLTFFEKNNSNKYDVSIEYDNNGLASIIRIKVQKN